MVEVALAAGTRSPLGVFGGAPRDVPTTDLDAVTARNCLDRAGLRADTVDHIIFTTTVPTDRDSLFAPRVVGIEAELLESADAPDIVRACASGLQAMLSAHEMLAGVRDRRARGSEARLSQAAGLGRLRRLATAHEHAEDPEGVIFAKDNDPRRHSGAHDLRSMRKRVRA